MPHLLPLQRTADDRVELALLWYVVQNQARACWYAEREGDNRFLDGGAPLYKGVTVTDPESVGLPPDADLTLSKGDILVAPDDQEEVVRCIAREEAEARLVRVAPMDGPALVICGLDIPLRDQIIKMNAAAVAVLRDHEAVVMTPESHYRDAEARGAMERGLLGRLGALATKAAEVNPGVARPKATGPLDRLASPFAIAASALRGKEARLDGPFGHVVLKNGFAIHYEDGRGGSRVYRDPLDGPAVSCLADSSRDVYTVRTANGGIERLNAAAWAARAPGLDACASHVDDAGPAR